VSHGSVNLSAPVRNAGRGELAGSVFTDSSWIVPSVELGFTAAFTSRAGRSASALETGGLDHGQQCWPPPSSVGYLRRGAGIAVSIIDSTGSGRRHRAQPTPSPTVSGNLLCPDELYPGTAMARRGRPLLVIACQSSKEMYSHVFFFGEQLFDRLCSLIGLLQHGLSTRRRRQCRTVLQRVFLFVPITP